MFNTLINFNSEAHMDIPPSQMDNQRENSALEGEGDERDVCRGKSLYFNPQYSSLKHIKHL